MGKGAREEGSHAFAQPRALTHTLNPQAEGGVLCARSSGGKLTLLRRE